MDGELEPPQKFLDLHSRNKVDDETLHKCRRDGIKFDMEIETLDCDDYIEMIDDVDIEKEQGHRHKSRALVRENVKNVKTCENL